MSEKTQGIVIRTTDYKEKDRIVTIFTPYGLRTVTARGVRSEKAKLRAAASVLAFGEFVIGGKADAKVLSGAEIEENFFDAWRDLRKMASLFYCCELTEKCFAADEDTRREFVFLMKIVKEIAFGQTEPLCLSFAYTVFCARSAGVDYTEIAEYDAEAYAVAESFFAAEPEEVGTLPYGKEKVLHAFTLVRNAFKNRLGVRLHTFPDLV